MLTRLSTPLKVGFTCAAIGIVLTLVGVARGNVPLRPANIAMALLIGGGFWFLVSWAIATTAVDVENDIAAAEFVDAEPVDEQV